jgi:hypothetical protein
VAIPGKPANPEPEVYACDVLKGTLKAIGGSMSDDWNNILVNQTIRTLWVNNSDAEEISRQRHAAVDALIGISPRDELEGMIAAQLLACHNASMECYRRAMLREQTFEGRRENLSHANKLSRTYATLIEALNRYRGKGHQKVTVEHVHVHEGGQAIVGNVSTRSGGRGREQKKEEQSHAIPYSPGRTMPCPDPQRDLVPVASDAERPMQDARRNQRGRPKGNRNALKHGRYTTEAINSRRAISELIRAARQFC